VGTLPLRVSAPRTNFSVLNVSVFVFVISVIFVVQNPSSISLRRLLFKAFRLSRRPEPSFNFLLSKDVKPEICLFPVLRGAQIGSPSYLRPSASSADNSLLHTARSRQRPSSATAAENAPSAAIPIDRD
jgi:hypothetical protein